MPTPIYHYTTGDRFLRIIADRAILPATAVTVASGATFGGPTLPWAR